jgi:nonsense-mediated mRNA decay protein 3
MVLKIMFCVECGKEGEIYKDGVCIECYVKNKKFTQGPEILDLPVCTHCQGYKYKNTWKNEILNDILRKLIKNNFEISRELEKVDINTNCSETLRGLECKVYISGFIQEKEITEEHELFIRLRKTVCETCSRQFGGYHEAIIQVRTEKRKFSNEELSDIRSTVEIIIENMQAKGNKTLFIADVAEEHGGLDFYISDKNAGFTISKMLLDKYGGYIKQSSTNTGMKDSKQIYKMTYLVRISPYKKGDIIKSDDTYYQIKNLQANKVKLINLVDWQETSTDLKNLENARMLSGEETIREMIIVSQTKNELQLMDEKTYELHVVKKPEEIEYKTSKIQVIKIDDLLFVPPKLHK